MADCNDIEQLLNELIQRLDNGGSQNLDALIARVSKLERDTGFITRKNVEQDRNIFKIALDIARLGKGSSFQSRLQRLEIQMRAQIAFTAKLNTLAKKTDNDFRFAVRKFSERFDFINRKNTDQDAKIKTIDEQLTVIKLALAVLTGAGGALAAFTAKLAAIVAKQKLIDSAIENLKRLSESRRKGEKGDKGDKGDKGNTGKNGSDGLKGNDGAQGRQGIQGIKGDIGSSGAQGRQGIQGIKGDKGEQGIRGLKGEQGIRGLKGDIGEKGAVGEVQIVETQVVVRDVQIVEVPTNVFNEPDLSDLLEKTEAIKDAIDTSLSVEVFDKCNNSTNKTVNTLSEFLAEVELKLVLIKNLICKTDTYSDDNLGDFDHSYSQGVGENFGFLKLTVIEFPVGYARKFPRFQNEPLLFDFGLVTFGNNFGREQSQPIRYEQSIYYPINDFKPTYVTIFTNQNGIVYNLTIYIKE